MTKKQIFIISLYFLFWIFLFFIGGIISLLSAFISISLYSVIFYGFYFLWKKLTKKNPIFYSDFSQIFLYKLSFFLFLCFWIIWGFSYYQNEISPAKMPFYTISNGNKIVKFQAMVHIGTPNFYKSVQKNIRQSKKNGYVLFFEGVKSWKEENMKKFDQALGINFTPDLYKNFSRLYGLTFQDNSQLLGLVNNYDFNIDLTIDEIIRLYDELPKNEAKNIPSEVQDVDTLVLEELSKLNEKQLQILVYVNQAIMNFIIKNDKLQKGILANFWNSNLFEVILNKRNELIVSEIQKSKYDKIFITYWLLHFQGIFDKLKEKDKNWKIIKQENFYPIKN